MTNKFVVVNFVCHRDIIHMVDQESKWVTCKDVNMYILCFNTLTFECDLVIDQWSPINTSGKKCYDVNLLKQIRDDPLSKDKPDDIPKLEECNIIRVCF